MACREAIRNNERLYYKFICEYFEGAHNDLFLEAHKFFKEVKQMYPEVKDVTKTQEFMLRVTPNVPIPRYYQKRRANRPKPSPLMQLRIPLMNMEELHVGTATTCVSDSNVQELQASMDVQDVAAYTTATTCVSDSNVQELQALMDVQDAAAYTTATTSVSDSNVQELQASMDVQDAAAYTTATTCVSDSDVQELPALIDYPTLPLLSGDVCEALMREIREDQDLMRILNDFPDFNDIQPDDELQNINPMVWHEAQPDDISPLEDEILNIF